MKKNILTFLLLLCGVVVAHTATNFLKLKSTDNPPISTKDEIEIRAIAAGGPLKSTSQSPIYMWKMQGQLELAFEGDLGAVAVQITNEEGTTVYQTTVNTTTTSGMFISTLNWSTGAYVIYFTTTSKSWYGVFEL